jgi:predicted amidohydrolase YtcJ
MLIIANAEIAGRRADVRIDGGRIAEIGRGLRGGPVIDAAGGALIPGLHDHHLHLLALAASLSSVDVSPDAVRGLHGLRAAIAGAPGRRVRAVNYHDSVAGPLSRDVLDTIDPVRPVRVQQRTGSLWVLNSAALREVLPSGEPPPCVETADGVPTGRIWRGDAWLRSRLPADPPDLAAAGALLARRGVTAVTDTSATTGASEAALLARAARCDALPQRLVLMSGGGLAPDPAFAVGPVKILLDDHDLPELGTLRTRIGEARGWGRAVAVHCVTAAELAITLAAFAAAGSGPGDRIEHGGVIPAAAIPVLARLGLTVATQPGLIAERGDRYRREVDAADLPDLYRCASLLRGGIPVLGSTDAPYTAPDPWAAMAAAIHRRTRSGAVLGGGERIPARAALRLFLARGAIRAGDPADLCLLRLPLAEALAAPSSSNLAATLIGGRIVLQAETAAEPQAIGVTS